MTRLCSDEPDWVDREGTARRQSIIRATITRDRAAHLGRSLLTLEDAQVRELVEAAKDAIAFMQFLQTLSGARKRAPTEVRLTAALVPFERRT